LTVSLHTSLRLLRCERLELFLLHEVEAHDLTDDLVEVLDRVVADGLIGAWGIGSARSKVDVIAATMPSRAHVLQFEWSILSEAAPTYPGALVLTHGALLNAFTRLRVALEEPDRRVRWSEETGVDVGDERELSRLLLSAALRANPEGIVLFSSNRRERVRDNARLLGMENQPDISRFVEIVGREAL
jgi:diketogulonate reductase-like aldo/keto reductase